MQKKMDYAMRSNRPNVYKRCSIYIRQERDVLEASATAVLQRNGAGILQKRNITAPEGIDQY